ncbi:hypothetical protein PVK06_048834 [Gossypium arboreum]|uniref:RNase H type-1 domain-containing protein n=1 Tax=Gossypium arboreum TaxID=29729 RepID=A0ABR0MHJ1_GOSAR|nr:hypothetical protein PVK06_048834 [Gossypium arboreum]
MSRIATMNFLLGNQQQGTWVHINIDGVVQLDLGLAVVGGVVCDENRGWVFGYNRYLGKCSIFYVELWGILDGLKLIQRRGHDKVIIQSHAPPSTASSSSSSSASFLLVFGEHQQLDVFRQPSNQSQASGSDFPVPSWSHPSHYPSSIGS